MPSKGSADSTGASDPNASLAPALCSAPHAYAFAVKGRGGGAAKRSVEERLDAQEPRPGIAPSRAHAHALGVTQVGKGKVLGDTQRELPAGVKPLQRREAARAVHGMDAGAPEP